MTSRASSSVASPRLSAVPHSPVPMGLVSTRRRRAARPVAHHLVGVHDADHREPELGLLVVDRVAADGDRARLGDLLGAAAHHLADDLGAHRAGEREQVHRGERAAAHRVDVGERVGRGDPAEVVRVVDDGREEVDGQQRRVSSLSRYTAASSLVSKPSMSASEWPGAILSSTAWRSSGPHLAAQPALLDSCVSLIRSGRPLLPPSSSSRALRITQHEGDAANALEGHGESWPPTRLRLRRADRRWTAPRLELSTCAVIGGSAWLMSTTTSSSSPENSATSTSGASQSTGRPQPAPARRHRRPRGASSRPAPDRPGVVLRRRTLERRRHENARPWPKRWTVSEWVARRIGGHHRRVSPESSA